ncbi:hypothetical protein CMQ_5183 [Grosmannia clavigera kw1407]|uniref:Uncharacterized protein n=1 Tax=Grosmannia clavigera (strain kw1407 / UAMH 11150) TaxID=655863 RepID=F0XB62_GROCL|nr:uncharacterized protein CMQ_5183 [Grosmannia clavigera kw1407]EFX04921.1 hypothetical protein CMQ_5183 [Grosmannia clavigera kw1407]
MSSNIFRIFKPGGWTNEAKLVYEVQDLRQAVEALQGYIRDHGIAVPDVLPPHLHMHKHHPDSQAARPYHSHHHAQDLKPSYRPPEHSPGQNVVPSAPASAGSVVRMGDVDPQVAGMEFVLTLESPCLPHLHGDPENPEDASCHALTTTAQLVAMYPEHPIESSAERGALCQQVPGRMLDSLLSLSKTLCPEDHMTPVQAWSHIRSQPHFGGLELGALQSLAEKLRDSVKCHGYVDV